MQSTQRQLRFSFRVDNPSWNFLNSEQFKKTQYKNWSQVQKYEFLVLLAGKRNTNKIKGIFEV